jgi:hypothetical protein
MCSVEPRRETMPILEQYLRPAGSRTFIARVSNKAATAFALAAVKAFNRAKGSQGCFTASVRRTPSV